MAPRFYEYRSQMMNDAGENIIAAGGRVMVCLAGTAKRATIVDDQGAVMPNPFTPTRGFINFFVAESIAAVDLYQQDPFGNFQVSRGIVASGPNEFKFLSSDRQQVMTIPFHWQDIVAGAERDTGFVIPARAIALPGTSIEVTTLDAGITLSAGTLSTEGGTATLFANAQSVAAVGVFAGGPAAPNGTVAGRKVSMTLSAGADTAAGFIYIPLQNAAP